MRSPDLRRGAICALSLALAGCGGGSGSILYSPDISVSNKLGNLIAFDSTKAPPLASTGPTASAFCPEVVVLDGSAAQRVYAGSENSETLRYQFSLGEVNRECFVQGDKLSIRVGVEARVLLGPAGTPGTYTLPIRLDVIGEKSQAVVASKVYKLAASVPAGGSAGTTSLLADPLVVPNLSDHSDDDYSVKISIETGAGARVASRGSRKRS